MLKYRSKLKLYYGFFSFLSKTTISLEKSFKFINLCESISYPFNFTAAVGFLLAKWISSLFLKYLIQYSVLNLGPVTHLCLSINKININAINKKGATWV